MPIPTINSMKAKVSLDQSGRFVLPKAFCSRLNLQEGDMLEIETARDEVRIRRVTVDHSQIVREHGRAVWDAPMAAATVEEIEASLARGYGERDSRASGL